MTIDHWEKLRPFCRDDAAFEQLKGVLHQREVDRDQHQLDGVQPDRHTQLLKAQHQAAEAASQAKSRFLAMVSHELRTPLNSILGLSALLSRQMVGPLTPKQAEYLGYIHASGEHLLAIISDILDLSRVEAGQEQLQLSSVSVPELCQSCLAMVQPRASEKDLTLTSNIDDDVTACMADERRLRQMLLNLLSNAIKFTPQGQVTLTVQRCNAGVEFCVEDTGIGIAAEDLEQIFQPFTQIDRNLNRQYDGAGLGLTLTRQLAQLHGGDLRVESAVGQGSRFCLDLPLGAGAMDSDPSAGAGATPGQRLVLIDGELSRHQALVAYVRLCGWRVVSCDRWAEVYQQVAAGEAGLVVVGSGEAGNPDLAARLRQLKAMTAPPKVVVLFAEGVVPPQALEPKIGEVDLWMPLPLTIPKLERLLSL